MEKRTSSMPKNLVAPIKIIKKQTNENSITKPKIDKKKENPPNNFTNFYQSKQHLAKHMKVCDICNQTMEIISYNFHLESHPSKILDWLYIGSYNNATNKKELELFNIKYIVNCAKECNNLFPNDINYKNFKLTDQLDTSISEHFDDCINFLNLAEKNKENVLVHCQLGKSRSVSMVIGYLIRNNRMSFEEAYKFVKCRRKSALPNLGFIKQLKDLEKSENLQFRSNLNVSNKPGVKKLI